MRRDQFLKNIPPEVQQQLREVIEAARSTMATLEEEPDAAPLESTPEGIELRDAIDVAKTNIEAELRLYGDAIGSRGYVARAFILLRERKGKRDRWRLEKVVLAPPNMLHGTRESLQAFLSAALEAEGGVGVALWVRGMPAPAEEGFFAYAMHSSGLDTALVMRADGWTGMRRGPQRLAMTLAGMVREKDADAKRWDDMTEAFIGLSRTRLREPIAALFVANNAVLTDETWEEVLNIIYRGEENLGFLKEAARSMGTPLIYETQRLQGAMVHLVTKALAAYTNKIDDIDKSHARALKRFKADRDSHRAAKDTAVNRARQLDREIASLRRQLKESAAAAPAGGQVSVAPENFVGLALDRLFTAGAEQE